jgi:DNA-binding NarL/FixJ family response regulator
VLVADDSPIFRAALEDLIRSDAGLEWVGSATDATNAVRLAEELLPDVVITDLEMPGGGGLHVAERLTALEPNITILCLSASPYVADEAEVLAAGASRFLPKEGPPSQLLKAIHGRHRPPS